MIDFKYPDDVDLAGWRPPTKVHARQIGEAAKAINEAQRPIVYAGGGVLNGDACVELRELVEAGQLPVVTTLMGKSCLPDSHPLNYGPPGMHGSKYANWALNKADLIIAVGARFDDRVTGKVSAFAPGAKVIHFDVDAAEVGKIRKAEIPVVGPLDLALTRAHPRAARAARRRDARAGGVAPPARGVARALSLQVPARRRRAEAADRRRDAPRPDGGTRRHDLDDRRRPAPDVGDAVHPVRRAALVHHVGRARDDGLRRSRPRSARRPPARMRPSSASTATAASR